MSGERFDPDWIEDVFEPEEEHYSDDEYDEWDAGDRNCLECSQPTTKSEGQYCFECREYFDIDDDDEL
jgi:hypothetical protein